MESGSSATERDPDRDVADDVRGRFVERFARDLARSGWPRMPARVFAAVLISPHGRRTSAQLVAELEISAAAVSGAVRYLEDIGFIERVRQAGSRRDAYQLLNEVWYESFARADERFARAAAILADATHDLDAGSDAHRRLDDAREFFEFLRESFPDLMATWKQRTGRRS